MHAGNYSQWLEARAARLKQEGKEQSALQRAIDAELDFVRSQAKGQQKKGKARMRRYDDLVDQASILCWHFAHTVLHNAAPWRMGVDHHSARGPHIST